MSDSCELCAAEGGPVAHMHVHQVPDLVYTAAGFIYEGHPMKVLGLTTKDRGTDNPGLEIRMVTMEEYHRRRDRVGLPPLDPPAARAACDPNNGHECGRCGDTWVEP